MATINYFIEVLWRFFCFCFFACFCFCFFKKVNLFERNRMMVKATFVYLDLRILKVVASSFFFYWVAALLMWCISHDVSCFTWLNHQVNQLKWTMGNLLAHITHLLKRQMWTWPLDLKRRTQTSLVGCSPSQIFLSFSFPQIIFSMWQKQQQQQKHSPGFIWLMLPELMTRGKRLSFRILTLKSPHKGIALSQLGSPAWISHMDKRWKILLDPHSLKVNAHHNT